MLTRARGCSCSQHVPTFHMRPIPLRSHSAQFTLTNHTLSPRPSFERKASRSFHGASASSRVAGRHSWRGRNLRRSPPTSTTTFSFFKAHNTTTQSAPFSNTSATMTATKIDGTAIAKKIREKLHAEIQSTQKINPRYRPSLKIIQGKLLCTVHSYLQMLIVFCSG